MKITEDKRNDVFGRKEVTLVVEAEKTPGFDESKKIVSEKFSKPEENIKIRSVYGTFGNKTFEIKAYVYDSTGDLEKSVQRSRKQIREEKKAAAEAKKAEEEAKKKSAEEAAKPAEAPSA